VQKPTCGASITEVERVPDDKQGWLLGRLVRHPVPPVARAMQQIRVLGVAVLHDLVVRDHVATRDRAAVAEGERRVFDDGDERSPDTGQVRVNSRKSVGRSEPTSLSARATPLRYNVPTQPRSGMPLSVVCRPQSNSLPPRSSATWHLTTVRPGFTRVHHKERRLTDDASSLVFPEGRGLPPLGMFTVL
jgi:hypothetical protein